MILDSHAREIVLQLFFSFPLVGVVVSLFLLFLFFFLNMVLCTIKFSLASFSILSAAGIQRTEACIMTQMIIIDWLASSN